MGKELTVFDYEAERKRFTWEIPEEYNFVEVVRRWAEDRTKVLAITEHPDGTVERAGYREVWAKALRFGAVLRDSGIQKGDRVMMLLPRGTDIYTVSIGIWAIGAVAVPCTIMLRRADIEYRLVDAEVKALVTSTATVAAEVEALKGAIPPENRFFVGQREGWRDLRQEIRAASRDLAREKLTATDPLVINYTSGTTGAPKGVLHTHSVMYCYGRLNRYYWWDTQSDELCWGTTEPGWTKWYWAPLGAIVNAGATNFHYAGKFDPEKFFALLAKWRINRACMTATELRTMAAIDDANERYDLTDLKVILTAGEPCTPGIIRYFEQKFGIAVREGYGQTETCVVACTIPGMEIKPGSMGRFTPGVDGAIVDPETGTRVPTGKKGMIAIAKGHPMLFKGYHNKPDKTAECYVGSWYLTGDLARMDETGYIWFESRADDVSISSGYRIGPFEVESAVNSHEVVLECAMVPSPDLLRGEIVKVFVVLKQGYEPSDALAQDIQQHVKLITAPYKYPRAIEFVDELPKTISGKIKRKELRTREFERKREVIEKLKEKGMWQRGG
ncbi:MAG: AMP-binding protein [Methanomicrobia archaeon]|nr:AMP-binding protein [Methanomicrobia archaeon]